MPSYVPPLRSALLSCRVEAGRAVVLSSGAWAGEFLAQHLGLPVWASAILPRKGHLLEVVPPQGMPPLRRGLMETGYTKHYAAAVATNPAAAISTAATPPAGVVAVPAVDITFTATASASGSLLVGSSRSFSGWAGGEEPAVVQAIMARAAQFLPALEQVHLREISTRVGLRPFSSVRRCIHATTAIVQTTLTISMSLNTGVACMS